MSRVNDIKLIATVDNESDAFDMVKNPGDLVVVERDGRPRRIYLICPCGQCSGFEGGMLLQVDPPFESRPSWKLDINEDKVTLSPSIRRLSHCHSHFWIKQGKIEWC